MKKSIILFVLAVLPIAFTTSCNKDDDNKIDTEKPQIDASIANSSPNNGSVFHFGEVLSVKLRLTDNQGLAAFSIEIHNNFDGHSHSTEDNEDEHEAEEHEHHHEEGEDGDAFYYTKDYDIPDNNSEFVVDIAIPLPEKSADGDNYAGGKYHFMLTVTDKAGFSTFKAWEIEILTKE